MPCETQRAALDSADATADNAMIDADSAWNKAINDAEAATAACGGEIGVGIVGGAMIGGFIGAGVGAVGGGLACLAGLYSAKNSAEDADAANKKFENALSAAGRALRDYYLCMERARMPPGG